MKVLRDDLILMRSGLERQLAIFGPPINLHTRSEGTDTTADSKARIVRCIAELDELLKSYPS